MINLLRKLFIKDYTNIKNENVRVAHGKLSAFFGIFSNLLLFIIKLLIGIFTINMSIISDSFNNLSDMSSSFVTLIGFHFSKKPADYEHPYGHERIEYIAELLVGIVIIFSGCILIYTSIIRIINYKIEIINPTLEYISIGILIFSIFVKIYQAYFNYKMGKLINSNTLKATAIDSRNDVIATSLALIGVIIVLVLYFNDIRLEFSLDSILGIIISIYVVFSGIGILKESINTLIGTNEDFEEIDEILNEIKNTPKVLGIHDVRCHSYGPTKKYLTMDVEINSQLSLIEAHNAIDEIEKNIKNKFNVNLTIHMDPILVDDDETYNLETIINKSLLDYDNKIGYHDLRIINKDNIKILSFDLEIPYDYDKSNEEIIDYIKNVLIKNNLKYELDIEIDKK